MCATVYYNMQMLCVTSGRHTKWFLMGVPNQICVNMKSCPHSEPPEYSLADISAGLTAVCQLMNEKCKKKKKREVRNTLQPCYGLMCLE